MCACQPHPLKPHQRCARLICSELRVAQGHSTEQRHIGPLAEPREGPAPQLAGGLVDGCAAGGPGVPGGGAGGGQPVEGGPVAPAEGGAEEWQLVGRGRGTPPRVAAQRAPEPEIAVPSRFSVSPAA